MIDPKGEYFGRRILSRDESGSESSDLLSFLFLFLTTLMIDRSTFLLLARSVGLTAKSIARLFPVDTSMVVIIDDRSDVWEGSRNLVKVVPCTFPSPFPSFLVLTSHTYLH